MPSRRSRPAWRHVAGRQENLSRSAVPRMAFSHTVDAQGTQNVSSTSLWSIAIDRNAVSSPEQAFPQHQSGPPAPARAQNISSTSIGSIRAVALAGHFLNHLSGPSASSRSQDIPSTIYPVHPRRRARRTFPQHRSGLSRSPRAFPQHRSGPSAPPRTPEHVLNIDLVHPRRLEPRQFP